MLLIAGGLPDPNLQALAQAAAALECLWVDLRIPAGSSPPFHWTLDATPADSASSGTPPWGDGPCPRGAFIRQDVFAAMADPRPEVFQRALGWFTAVQGWLLAHPDIFLFNRHIAAVAFNKPAALMRARAAGLRIPSTWVSNDVALLTARLGAPTIAKPVAGGGLCQTLDDALVATPAGAAFSAMPALIQPRLASPELRVFIIGEHVFTFAVDSPSLDYRALQDVALRYLPPPAEAEPLRQLMREFGMDFGAADFKTDPDTGALTFLELNTSPMFARFDEACDGALCSAMVTTLLI